MSRGCVPDRERLDELLTVERTFRNPVDYYLDANGAMDERYRLETTEGFDVELRPGTDATVPDREVVREVLVEGVYDRTVSSVEPGMTVLDVGAHIGTFSMRCGARIGDGTVIACEPHPRNYEQLQRNVRRNDFDAVSPSAVACASERGTIELSPSANNTGGHSTVYPTSSDGTVDVPATTVPDLMDDHGVSTVDVLKIDAEGAEYEILFDLPEEILASIDRIVLEEHRVAETERRYDDDALRSYLAERGFNVSKSNEVEYPDEGRFWTLHATRE